MNASDRTAIFETLPVHQAVYKQIIKRALKDSLL